MNTENQSQGTWFIVLTLFIAMVLAVIPLPQILNWARPEWILLVFVFWVVSLPHRMGILVGGVLGLAVDILIGAPMGLNAFTYALVAYLILYQHQRVQMFPPLQQTILIFLLVGLNQMVNYWLYSMFMVEPKDIAIFTPAITSAVVWPFLIGILQHLQHQIQVQ